MATAPNTGAQGRIIPSINRMLTSLKLPPMSADTTMENLADKIGTMATVLEGLGETDAALKMSNAGRPGNGTKPRSAVVREFALNRGIPLEQADKLVP